MTGYFLIVERICYVAITRCNPFLHEKGKSAPTRILVQIPLTECRLLEHESLRQRFIHAGLLKAREYAWPQVAQRIMNY